MKSFTNSNNQIHENYLLQICQSLIEREHYQSLYEIINIAIDHNPLFENEQIDIEIIKPVIQYMVETHIYETKDLSKQFTRKFIDVLIYMNKL